MGTKPYATLTGVRGLPAPERSCSICGKDAQPHVIFNSGPKSSIQHVICVPCMGRAVEKATGWKVLNAWSQWLAQQLSGIQIRALKEAQQDARKHGLPEPTHAELPQWTKMR